MSADRGTDEENVVDKHWRKYYTAFQKVEILPFVTTRMNFEDLMLSEISQTQKDKCRVISFIRGTWNSDTHRSKEQKRQLPEPGRGEGGLVKRSKGGWASGAIVASAVSYTRNLLKEQVLKAVAAKEGNQKERREEEGRGKHVRWLCQLFHSVSLHQSIAVHLIHITLICQP